MNPTLPTTTPAPVTPTGGAMALENVNKSFVPTSPEQTAALANVNASFGSSPSNTPTSPSTTPTPANNPVPDTTIPDLQAKEKGYLDDIQKSSDTTQAAYDAISKLDAGTIPLNSAQNAQLQSTRDAFQAVIRQQELANKNFIGGTEVAQERQGLSMYSPQMAQGNIFAATNEANQKIADLNSKMNLALSSMEEGFREGNYMKVKEGKQAIIEAQKEKSSTLENLYNVTKAQEAKVVKENQDRAMSVVNGTLLDDSISLEERKKKVAELVASGALTQDQIKEVQNTIRQTTQDEITNQLNSDKFTWEQKKDIADNAIKSGELDIKRANFELERSKYNDEQTKKLYAMNNPGENSDALALANEFAVTGKMPPVSDLKFANTSAGQIAQIAKESPKAKGVIVNKQTGVNDSKMPATEQQDFSRLYNIVNNVTRLKELDAKRVGGLYAGTLGSVFGGTPLGEAQAEYLATRKAIVDDISRMQSGAALTPSEVSFYEDYLPGRFSEPFGVGQNSDKKIENFETIMNNRLKERLDSNNLSIYGYSKVPIAGKEYTVGDIVQGENEQQGRINADGSITLLK